MHVAERNIFIHPLDSSKVRVLHNNLANFLRSTLFIPHMADAQPTEINPPKKRGRPKGSKNKSAPNTDSVAASKSKKSTKKRLTAQPDVPLVETLQEETQVSAVTDLSVHIE